MKKKAQHRKTTKKPILIGAIALVAVLAIGGTSWYLAKRGQDPNASFPNGNVTNVSLEEMKAALEIGTIYKGIYINDQDVSGKTKEEVLSMFDEGDGIDNQDINIVLSVNGSEYPLQTAGLKLKSNIQEIVEEAYQYGRSGDGSSEEEIIRQRYQKVIELEKTPKYFQTSYTLSEDEVSTLVHEVLDPLSTELVEATVIDFDVENKMFVIEESQDGVVLDVDSAVQSVKEALDNGEYDQTVYVGASIVKAATTKEFLESYLGLVSSTTTSTSNDRNRNINIRLVCETVNGLILQPGEYFNYNEFVGKRTAEKGYKEAGGIYDGAMRQELGGGICQVSGTMYHSVLKADLQVDERHPHSWPSTYVATGTDATVTWEGANFQFTNNTEYPVVMVAEYKDKDNGYGGWCTVEIYGRPIPDGMTIEVIGVVHSSKAPTTIEYVADPTMIVGETDTERDPHNAISASAYQVFYKGDEEVKRVKASSSYYRMINAKVLVGVLDEDGITIHTVDPETGEVIMAEPTPDPSETTTDPSETVPTGGETTAE